MDLKERVKKEMEQILTGKVQEIENGLKRGYFGEYYSEIEILLSHISTLEANEKKLRKLLWLNHGCTALYGDDGEMQCSKCGLDFKRHPIGLIEKKITERGLKALLANREGK